MFFKALQPRAVGIAAIPLALAAGSAAADLPATTDPKGAQALVSGLSVQRTVQNEARPREEVSKNPLPELDSRLELSAGTDHLLDSPGFLKQSSVFAEGRYRVNEWLQLGASTALRVQGDGNGSADLAAQLLVGPTFNFGTGSGLENAFFLSPKIGPTLAHTVVDGGASQSETRLAAELTIGKRFAIGKSFAFAPAIGEIWQSGYKPCVVAQPIALSLFF